MPEDQICQQILGELGLTIPISANLGREDRVRAALGQRQQPRLRKRRLLTLVHTRPTKEPLVDGRICHIQARPIDGHQSSVSQPCPRRVRPAQRPRHPREQRGQRLRSQPFPGLKDRRLARQPIVLAPPRSPGQTISELRQHIFIRALRIQAHPDREVRHHPRRQRPMSLLRTPRLRNHFIDQRRREHPRQHPHRHQIRQPTIRLRLTPTRPRHTPQTTRM